MKRFLALVSLFALSVPAFSQADLQDVVDAVDEVAELLYNLNSRIGFIADGPHRLTLEDGIDRLDGFLQSETYYFTNQVDWRRTFLPGIRQDLFNWLYPYAPRTGFSNPTIGIAPDDSWSFLWWGWGNDEYGLVSPWELHSHVEFENLVFGQNVDGTLLNRDINGDAFDFAFSWHEATNNLDQYGVMLWNIWQAEAWRRLLSLQESSPAVWTNNIASTNALDEAYKQAGLTNDTGEAVSMSLPAPVEVNTNAVAWFGDGNGPAPKLAGDLEWDLQGESNQVRIFGFDELNKSLSGTLAVDFTSAPFPFIRTCCRLLVAVSTCVCLFMILRHEVDYWTTLGGSAT